MPQSTASYRPVMIVPAHCDAPAARDLGLPVLVAEESAGNPFVAACSLGYTHGVTVEAGVRPPAEAIAQLLQTSREMPQALIVGWRNDPRGNEPLRRRIGRALSNYLVWTESGVRVRDSQCRLRVYPLKVAGALKCRSRRFGFETEILTRAGWAGCEVVEVPVKSSEQPSPACTCGALHAQGHAALWRDALRGTAMHTWLLTRALVPWPHRRLVPKRVAPGPRVALWRRVLKWLSPLEAWRQLRKDALGRVSLASSLSVGVFIANLPAYGFQTLLALYAARRLHLHPLATVAGSQASTPPIGLGLIWLAVCVGHLLMHGGLPPMALLRTPVKEWFTSALPQLAADWAVGSVIVGLALAAVTFAVTMLLLKPLKAKAVVEEAAVER